MPCYTIQKSTVELKNVDKSILANALESLGLRVVVSGDVIAFSGYLDGKYVGDGSFVNGQLSMNSQINPNIIKRAYSAQVVQTAAKRFGWNLQKKDETHFVAQRRF